MPSGSKALLFVLLLIATFLAGYWLHQPTTPAAHAGRQPLYYHDPMHPAYKSAKPGIAPDCGMRLEPVYAGDPAVSGPTPAGAVRISVEQQNIMGLKTAPATRASGLYTVRVLGRVSPDESRIYRVTAQADGVMRSVSRYAAGDIVRKDDLLATYFVTMREVYNAIQSYFVAMNAQDKWVTQGNFPGMLDAAKAELRVSQELLQTYGLTETQIKELARTRQITRDIEFRSPVAGLLLARSAFLGQRVDRGTELYRIADLSQVWVLADLFENESGLVRPGAPARVRYQDRTYRAAIGEARQFDPASRTLKLRLEVQNPESVLRPDMFVDVEFDVKKPDGISVPRDAILDSGRRKVVFVSTEPGMFEPREVITGVRYGDRVQILKGLRDAEQIVVSGTFLIDSETRLRQTAANVKDPVCGMDIDPAKAAGKSEYKKKTYYFCSPSCKEKFDKNPESYLGKQQMAQRHD